MSHALSGVGLGTQAGSRETISPVPFLMDLCGVGEEANGFKRRGDKTWMCRRGKVDWNKEPTMTDVEAETGMRGWKVKEGNYNCFVGRLGLGAREGQKKN